MPFGAIGFDGHGCSACRDASLEDRFPVITRRVTTEPIARSRELPCGLEVLCVLLQPLGPDRNRSARTREIVAMGIERIGIG